MRITDQGLVDAGWEAVEGALEVFSSSEDLIGIAGSPETLVDLGLILGGDFMALRERVAIASTNFRGMRSDESTVVSVVATGMVESERAKGTGWTVSTHLSGSLREPGREAARNAINGIGHERVSSGTYPVVLGPLVITDILNFFMLDYFTADLFYVGASPFMGQLGQQIASDEFSMYDDGSVPGMAGSKGFTDDGIPTGRTELVRNGKLVGLLSNWYESQRLSRDPDGKAKLGVDPKEWVAAFAPRNGFRSGDGGGRNFGTTPQTTATNLFIEGATPRSREELFKMVGDGLYIGRTWYMYPINGIAAGDFSGTVIADSYLIKDGKLAEPIRPNVLRINDNIRNVLEGVIGVTTGRRPTLIWSAGQVVHAPEIAIKGLAVEEIAEYMETV